MSASTVGRTLARLRRLGHLREPALVRAQIRPRPRRPVRVYARRKPWAYRPEQPGDLVALDTTPISILPGVRRIHFTARDVVSRKDVVAAYSKGNSQAATCFLREELPRLGVPIRALQIDGGSESKAAFEQACQELGIALFVLPPRSPRLNRHVERANRTHQEEFYDLQEVPEDLIAHNALLREWEGIYNDVRPHQALGYLTPTEYLARHHL